jgi:hypothetical protein
MNRPIKTKSGTLLTTLKEQMKRWEEHFSEIFFRRGITKQEVNKKCTRK